MSEVIRLSESQQKKLQKMESSNNRCGLAKKSGEYVIGCIDKKRED